MLLSNQILMNEHANGHKLWIQIIRNMFLNNPPFYQAVIEGEIH